MTLTQKNSVWNMIGATLNAFTSLIYVIIVTWVNGVDNAGIFSFAFSMGIVLFCFGNYITRPFQVTDVSEKYSDSDYIYLRIFTCTVPVVFCVAFCLIKGYSTYKSTIILLLCLYSMTEAFSETMYAVTQKNNLLYKVGVSMTVRALSQCFVFFVIDYITRNLVLATSTLVIINVLVCIFYDIPSAKKSGLVTTKFSLKICAVILGVGFFNFALTLLNSFMLNIQKYAIDDACSDEMQAIFGYIIMPATFMNLLGQYIIQPVLTTLSDAVKNKNADKFIKTSLKTISVVFMLGIPVFIVAYFLEAPVLSLVFGVNLEKYKTAMMIIIVGSVFYALQVVISYILISCRVTFSQVVVYGIVSVLSFAVSYKVVSAVDLTPCAVVYSCSMFAVFLGLGALLLLKFAKMKKEWN